MTTERRVLRSAANCIILCVVRPLPFRKLLRGPGRKAYGYLPNIFGNSFKDLTGALIQGQVLKQEQLAKGCISDSGSGRVFYLTKLIMLEIKIVHIDFLVLFR